MDMTQTLDRIENSYTIRDAAEVFFSKLDEGIDDYENGRVVSSEELWEEVDAI